MAEGNRPPADWMWLARQLWGFAQVGAVAFILFIVGVAFAIFLNLRAGKVFLGTPDYGGFYAASIILNEHLPGRLYDQNLQHRILNASVPGAQPGMYYPFAHIPIVAFLLRPMAKLSFPWSYALWLTILAAVAAVSLVISGSRLTCLRPFRRGLLLLGAAFPPMALECWLAGQWSIIGFLSVALALRLAYDDRPFASGFALSFCFYKPTLMLFVLPVLLLSGKKRLLAGAAIGGLILAALSFLAVGVDGSVAYAEMLMKYGKTMSAGAGQFKVFKQVDLNSFCMMLFGRDGPAKTCLAVIAVCYSALLLRAWWFHKRNKIDGLVLALCATLTGNLVFNAYTPIYDVSLIIPNILITLEIACRLGRIHEKRWLPKTFGAMAGMVVCGAWITQMVASRYNFQPLTIVLLLWGCAQAGLLLWHPAPISGGEATSCSSSGTAADSDATMLSRAP